MNTKHASPLAVMAAIGLMALAFRLAVAQESRSDWTADEMARGKRLFENYCGRCHGIRATGGVGPSLVRSKLRHASEESALRAVITGGIPGTAMPGNYQMSPKEVQLVVAYVRSLGQVASTPPPGDPLRGKALYEGKGECIRCHSIRNQGGVQGPDLTEIGARRGADHLRRALVDPGADLPDEPVGKFSSSGYAQFLPVRVVTRDGREIAGVRANEDAFTIQIRDANNALYSFRKEELKELRKEFGQSLMPSYATSLSASELDDLVAYLAGLRGDE